jgi:hypothetical protein
LRSSVTPSDSPGLMPFRDDGRSAERLRVVTKPIMFPPGRFPGSASSAKTTPALGSRPWTWPVSPPESSKKIPVIDDRMGPRLRKVNRTSAAPGTVTSTASWISPTSQLAGTLSVMQSAAKVSAWLGAGLNATDTAPISASSPARSRLRLRRLPPPPAGGRAWTPPTVSPRTPDTISLHPDARTSSPRAILARDRGGVQAPSSGSTPV